MKKKTHKGTAKRFSLTGTGKLKHDKAGKSHLRVKKGATLRVDKYGRILHGSEYKKIIALIPYK